MKRQKTDRIKNDLPELLEAVCNHKDCPEWLSDAIWDAVSERSTQIVYSALQWRAHFEAMPPEDEEETDEKKLPQNVLTFRGVQ